MAQFRAYSPDVEVRGAVVRSVIEAMGAFRKLALEILEANGIGDPQPETWYRQQAWLDAFADIARKVGPTTVYQIGRQVPAMADIEPEIDNLEKALSQLDRAYRSQHRGGEIGEYGFSTDGLRGARIVSTTPYPCDFDHGVVYGLAQRFEAHNALLDVRVAEGAECKQNGGASSTYLVRW